MITTLFDNHVIQYDPCLSFTHFNTLNGLSESICYTKRIVHNALTDKLLRLRVQKAVLTRVWNKAHNTCSYKSLIVSRKRALRRFNSILDCNHFTLFVTLTFDKHIVERLDDNVVRNKYKIWVSNLSRKFSNMFYVAVPEYHNSGGIHFHCLFGGISYEDLQPYNSGVYSRSKGDEAICSRLWKFGLSDVQIINSSLGAKSYVSKYIQKFTFDLRFFNKKRFYYGGCITKPIVKTYIINLCKSRVDYLNFDKVCFFCYTKFYDNRFIEVLHDNFIDTVYNQYINVGSDVFTNCS